MKAHFPGLLLAVSTLAAPAIVQGTTFEPWIYQNGTRLHGDNLWKEGKRPGETSDQALTAREWPTGR